MEASKVSDEAGDPWADRVRGHTVIERPPLCPELRLHLITEACPLWRATETDLASVGLVEPYWGFAWPGGQALARFLLDHPDYCRGRTVLDFGAGGGIAALAAARSGAFSVCAADIDPVAAAACRLNALLNGLTLRATSENLLPRLDIDAELIVVGDATYDERLAAEVVQWLRALVREGRTALVADPGRGFLSGPDLEPVAVYDAPADVDVGGRYRVKTTVYRVSALKPG